MMRLLKRIWKQTKGYLPLATLVMLILTMSLPAYASYSYYVSITISNNTTNDYTYLPVLITMNNTELVTSGYIDADGLNTNFQVGGSDYVYSVIGDKLGVIVPSFLADEDKSATYYLNYLPDPTADYPLVTGHGGYITTSDDVTLELGDNFTVEQYGYIDTSAGSDKNLIYKENSFRTYVSGAETVTSEMIEYSTYPQVAAENGGNDLVDWNSHIVNLPAGINAGDLLLAFFCTDNSGTTTISFPAGWTQIFQDENNADELTVGAWYRVADGGEGASINATTSNNQMTAHTTYRITDYAGTPEVGTSVKNVASAYPNPPSLTASWGELPNLWFAVTGYDNGTVTVNAYPTNYANGRNDRSNNASGCGIGVARREYSPATDDPGAFTLSGVEQWVSNTIVIEAVADTVSVSAAGVTTDEHKVTTKTTGGNLKIYIDDIEADSSALGGVSCTDNNEDWYFGENNVIAYTDYTTFTTDSGLTLWYQPVTIINSYAVDRSGFSNHGTISWGTNPAGVEYTLHGITDAEAFVAGEEGEGLTPPTVFPLPTNWNITATNTSGIANLWLYPLVNRTATSLGWSAQTMYVVIGLIAATGIGFGALIGTGSMLGFTIGFGTTAGIFASTGVMPWWIIIIIIGVIGMGIYTWKRG